MLHRIAALLIAALVATTLIGVTPAFAAEPTAQDIARLKAQCDKGESRSCGVLGSNYEKGEGVTKDLAAALKLYLRACSLGEGFRCGLAGDAYMEGAGATKDTARAIGLYQRGCGLDDGYTCSILSVTYATGTVVPASSALALELKEKACRLGAGMCDMLEANSRDLLLGVNKPLPEFGTHIKFCEGGDMGWCALLGMRYQDNVGVDWSEQNEPLAVKYYTMACDAGKDEACQHLGPLLARYGLDDYPRKPRDRQYDVLAVKALQKSCDMGWGTNCSLLGDMVRRGVGTTRNVTLADQLRERGCVLWSMVCPKELEAAAKARAAKAPPAPKQSAAPAPAKAARSPAALQAACDRNDYGACVELGLLYDGGKGVPVNLATGYALFKKACDGGNDRLGCVIMGNSLRDGRGVAKNPAAAIVPTAKACNSGSSASCYALAWQFQEGLGVAKDQATANRHYARGCELGSGDSCAVLGARNSSGTYLAKNVAEGIRLYQRACDLNVARACGLLSSTYFYGDGVAVDYAKAHALATKACNSDDGYGCLIAAFVQRKGVGGQPENFAAAARLFEKSCTLKHAAGCKRLGLVYAYGEGFPRDLAKAASFARMACQLDKAQCEAAPAATARTATQAATPGKQATQIMLPSAPLAIARYSPPTAPEVYFVEMNSIRSIATPTRNAALIWGLVVPQVDDRRLGVAASAYWQLHEMDCLEKVSRVQVEVAVDPAGKMLKAAAGGGYSPVENRTIRAAYWAQACRIAAKPVTPYNSVAAAVASVGVK